MKKSSVFVVLLILSTALFCQSGGNGYDVILVVGQSNTLSGVGYVDRLDRGDPKLFQLGRYLDEDYKIIAASEPFQHYNYYAVTGKIGFVMQFAKLYSKNNPDRNILIIHCGEEGTGFSNHHWSPGEKNFDDAVDRTNYVINKYHGSKLVVILWHQGEQDVGFSGYQYYLDSMIKSMRNSIVHTGGGVVPFILGGMVPYWVAQDPTRQAQQKVIADTKNRLPMIGYADPTSPDAIVKKDKDKEPYHFDAAGQRELGKRYYAQYVKLTDGK